MRPHRLLLLFLAQAFATAQAQNSCSGVYTIFAALSGDAAADAFCSEYFPMSPVTSTFTVSTVTTVTTTSSTATTITSTSTSTVFTPSPAQKRRGVDRSSGPWNSVGTKGCCDKSSPTWQSTTQTHSRTGTSTGTSTRTTKTATSSQTHTAPNLFSSIVSAESSFASRACACITTASTTTVSTTTTSTQTSTSDVTGTVTSRTTTTVTSPCNPAITSNCVDRECYPDAPCCAGFTCIPEPPFNVVAICTPVGNSCPASVTSSVA